MRKKTVMLSVVIVAVFSSLAFAGVPFYRHSRENRSDDNHKNPSECQYSRVYRGESGDRDASYRVYGNGGDDHGDRNSGRQNASDEDCED